MLPSELKLKDHSFFLETFEFDNNSDLYKQKNLISAVKPIKKFHSFRNLQNFLIDNPKILNLKNSGFAGYIGYDKDTEIILYEEINKINLNETKSEKKIQLKTEKINYRFNKNEFIDNVKKCQNILKKGIFIKLISLIN